MKWFQQVNAHSYLSYSFATSKTYSNKKPLSTANLLDAQDLVAKLLTPNREMRLEFDIFKVARHPFFANDPACDFEKDIQSLLDKKDTPLDFIKIPKDVPRTCKSLRHFYVGIARGSVFKNSQLRLMKEFFGEDLGGEMYAAASNFVEPNNKKIAALGNSQINVDDPLPTTDPGVRAQNRATKSITEESELPEWLLTRKFEDIAQEEIDQCNNQIRNIEANLGNFKQQIKVDIGNFQQQIKVEVANCIAEQYVMNQQAIAQVHQQNVQAQQQLAQENQQICQQVGQYYEYIVAQQQQLQQQAELNKQYQERFSNLEAYIAKLYADNQQLQSQLVQVNDKQLKMSEVEKQQTQKQSVERINEKLQEELVQLRYENRELKAELNIMNRQRTQPQHTAQLKGLPPLPAYSPLNKTCSSTRTSVIIPRAAEGSQSSLFVSSSPRDHIVNAITVSSNQSMNEINTSTEKQTESKPLEEGTVAQIAEGIKEIDQLDNLAEMSQQVEQTNVTSEDALSLQNKDCCSDEQCEIVATEMNVECVKDDLNVLKELTVDESDKAQVEAGPSVNETGSRRSGGKRRKFNGWLKKKWNVLKTSLRKKTSN